MQCNQERKKKETKHVVACLRFEFGGVSVDHKRYSLLVFMHFIKPGHFRALVVNQSQFPFLSVESWTLIDFDPMLQHNKFVPQTV